MSDPGDEGRRFSDEEFAQILRKASELQLKRPERALSAGARPSEGLSLEEIQSIAKEAGIDPALVAEAAAALPAKATGTLAKIFGGTDKYHLEFSREGEVTEEDLGRIVDVIRRVAQHQGDVTKTLDTMEWKTVGEISQIYVNVTPRGGKTSVQIMANRSGPAVLSYVFPGMAAVVCIGGIGAALEPSTVLGVLSLIGGVAGGAFLVGRTIWSTSTKSFRRRLSAMMEAISGAVDDAVTPPDYALPRHAPASQSGVETEVATAGGDAAVRDREVEEAVPPQADEPEGEDR